MEEAFNIEKIRLQKESYQEAGAKFSLRRKKQRNGFSSFKKPYKEETVSAKITNLEASLAALGQVSPLALNELQQIEERLSFYQAQKVNVLSSVALSKKAMRVIEKESEKKLATTLKAANGHL